LSQQGRPDFGKHPILVALALPVAIPVLADEKNRHMTSGNALIGIV
jgi:hypothetical protein